MNARIRTAVAALVVVLLGTGLSGCGLTMGDIPIPGTGVSGDTIKVQADFRDALNLAEGAPVKINGVDAGKVDSIGEKDFTAEVTMTIRKDAQLHKGATARLRYTTPLGELFVDVTNPASGPVMADGAKMSLDDTTTAPTVEDALSEASLLINGGGLDQLQTVTEELNTALNGHEGDYRALIEKARTFLTQANATTGSIDQVLNSLNSLSKTLDGRKATINNAVRQIRPAAKVLREETPDFTKLLKSLNQFAGAANNTVDATRSQLLRMLQQVQPVLAEFAANKPRWRTSLLSVIRAAGVANNVVANDYLNISLQLHLDSIDLTGVGLDDLLQLLGLGDLLGGGAGGLAGGVTKTVKDLLDSLGLGGLLGRTTTTSPRTARSTSGGATGSTSGAGAASGTTDPAGVTALLGNLLGGGR